MKLIWEWWSQLWPNMFAISVWTTILFIWHHTALKKHITRELDKHHAHVPELLPSVHNHPGSIDSDSPLFARSEVEQSRSDIG